MRKKVLFIDRDGTIIKEPEITFQVDRLDQLEFLPGVIRNLYRIVNELDYHLVMVSNQDGLGSDTYPIANFESVQNKLLAILEGEDIVFSKVHIDKSYSHENSANRKPGIGMLQEYFSEEYDLANSYVIGDRVTDILLANNLGARSIFIRNNEATAGYEDRISLIASRWDDVYEFLKRKQRLVKHCRDTNETSVQIELNPDGNGTNNISTGIGFFDHMLEQLSRHSLMDIKLVTRGDLHIDEHHTIEDTAIALGEAIGIALGDKKGMERFGYCLPMDDCLAQVAVDFGGRSWLVWDAEFKREKIGEMSTEMFYHFFKSFSEAVRCNLNIKAEGNNEHHKIESIFKALGKAVKMAIWRDPKNKNIPTTKGIL
jgi:imidazoleglycerol-phosphate dehydratase / histidinol-phosphatase